MRRERNRAALLVDDIAGGTIRGLGGIVRHRNGAVIRHGKAERRQLLIASRCRVLGQRVRLPGNQAVGRPLVGKSVEGERLICRVERNRLLRRLVRRIVHERTGKGEPCSRKVRIAQVLLGEGDFDRLIRCHDGDAVLLDAITGRHITHCLNGAVLVHLEREGTLDELVPCGCRSFGELIGLAAFELGRDVLDTHELARGIDRVPARLLLIRAGEGTRHLEGSAGQIARMIVAVDLDDRDLNRLVGHLDLERVVRNLLISRRRKLSVKLAVRAHGAYDVNGAVIGNRYAHGARDTLVALRSRDLSDVVGAAHHELRTPVAGAIFARAKVLDLCAAVGKRGICARRRRHAEDRARKRVSIRIDLGDLKVDGFVSHRERDAVLVNRVASRPVCLVKRVTLSVRHLNLAARVHHEVERVRARDVARARRGLGQRIAHAAHKAIIDLDDTVLVCGIGVRRVVIHAHAGEREHRPLNRHVRVVRAHLAQLNLLVEVRHHEGAGVVSVTVLVKIRPRVAVGQLALNLKRTSWLHFDGEHAVRRVVAARCRALVDGVGSTHDELAGKLDVPRGISRERYGLRGLVIGARSKGVRVGKHGVALCCDLECGSLKWLSYVVLLVELKARGGVLYGTCQGCRVEAIRAIDGHLFAFKGGAFVIDTDVTRCRCGLYELVRAPQEVRHRDLPGCSRLARAIESAVLVVHGIALAGHEVLGDGLPRRAVVAQALQLEGRTVERRVVRAALGHGHAAALRRVGDALAIDERSVAACHLKADGLNGVVFVIRRRDVIRLVVVNLRDRKRSAEAAALIASVRCLGYGVAPLLEIVERKHTVLIGGERLSKGPIRFGPAVIQRGCGSFLRREHHRERGAGHRVIGHRIVLVQLHGCREVLVAHLGRIVAASNRRHNRAVIGLRDLQLRRLRRIGHNSTRRGIGFHEVIRALGQTVGKRGVLATMVTLERLGQIDAAVCRAVCCNLALIIRGQSLSNRIVIAITIQIELRSGKWLSGSRAISRHILHELEMRAQHRIGRRHLDGMDAAFGLGRHRACRSCGTVSLDFEVHRIGESIPFGYGFGDLVDLVRAGVEPDDQPVRTAHGIARLLRRRRAVHPRVGLHGIIGILYPSGVGGVAITRCHTQLDAIEVLRIAAEIADLVERELRRDVGNLLVGLRAVRAGSRRRVDRCADSIMRRASRILTPVEWVVAGGTGLLLRPVDVLDVVLVRGGQALIGEGPGVATDGPRGLTVIASVIRDRLSATERCRVSFGIPSRHNGAIERHRGHVVLGQTARKARAVVVPLLRTREGRRTQVVREGLRIGGVACALRGIDHVITIGHAIGGRCVNFRAALDVIAARHLLDHAVLVCLAIRVVHRVHRQVIPCGRSVFIARGNRLAHDIAIQRSGCLRIAIPHNPGPVAIGPKLALQQIRHRPIISSGTGAPDVVGVVPRLRGRDAGTLERVGYGRVAMAVLVRPAVLCGLVGVVLAALIRRVLETVVLAGTLRLVDFLVANRDLDHAVVNGEEHAGMTLSSAAPGRGQVRPRGAPAVVGVQGLLEERARSILRLKLRGEGFPISKIIENLNRILPVTGLAARIGVARLQAHRHGRRAQTIRIASVVPHLFNRCLALEGVGEAELAIGARGHHGGLIRGGVVAVRRLLRTGIGLARVSRLAEHHAAQILGDTVPVSGTVRGVQRDVVELDGVVA